MTNDRDKADRVRKEFVLSGRENELVIQAAQKRGLKPATYTRRVVVRRAKRDLEAAC